MADKMSLPGRLASIRAQIAEVWQLSQGKNRSTQIPRLLPVSKTKPVDMLREAYEAGERHFGENYIQEIILKAPQLPDDCRWHLIGHVQSNKVAALLKTVRPPQLFVVESIDSEKLAKKFDSAIAGMSPKKGDDGHSPPLQVMIELNTSGDEAKHGLKTDEEVILLAKYIDEYCPNLRVKGLMCIATFDDPEKARQEFSRLRKLKDRLMQERGLVEEGELELSMGMSADMVAAIEEGSTQLRIGTAIFGAREKKLKQEGSPASSK